MAELLNNVQYTSASTGSPFTVSLAAGFNSAPDGLRAFFYVRQDSDNSIFAEVEGIVTGANTLTVLYVHKSSTADATKPSGYVLPTFSGGVTIFSAIPATIGGSVKNPGRDGVLIIGQSNSVGYNGSTVDLSFPGYHPAFHTPDPDVLQYCAGNKWVNPYDGAWNTDPGRTQLTDANLVGKYVMATEPLQHAQDGADGFPPTNAAGFGLTFGKIYKASEPGARQVVLLPGGCGATGFTAGGTGKVWNNPDGTLYTNAVELCSTFLAENPDNRIVAILWHQGEYNASTAPATYQSYLDSFIQALRTNIKGNQRQPTCEAVPFILGGMSKPWIAAGTQARQDIDDVIRDTPNRVNYTAFADPPSTLGVGPGLNVWHFDGFAFIKFAALYYDAFKFAQINVAGATAPPAPNNIELSVGDGQIVVSWGSASTATAYVVEYRQQGAGSYTQRAQVTALTDTITGLSSSLTYEVRVFSRNATGDGFPSKPLLAKPAGVDTAPPAPASVSAVPGDTDITVTWSTVNHTPAVTGYIVRYRQTSVGGAYTEQAVAGQATASYVISGLTNNTSYDISVAAVNSVGTGNYTADTTATPSAPTTAPAPSTFNVVGQNAQVTATWSTVTHVPDVTGYNIRYRVAGSGGAYTNVPVSGQATTSQIIGSLTNGTDYEFSIASVNSVGNGTYTADVVVTPSASVTPLTDALAPVLQLRYNTGVISSTDPGRVERWEDQSGNGLHLEQSVLANKPALVGNAIDFNLVSSTEVWLQNGNAALNMSSGNWITNGYTMLIRFQDGTDPSSAFASHTAISNGNGVEARIFGDGRFWYSPNNSINNGKAVLDPSDNYALTTLQSRAFTHDASQTGAGGFPQLQLWDTTSGTATLLDTDDDPFDTGHVAFRIGCNFSNEAFRAKIHDIIVFDYVLTETQINQVVSELEAI